MNPSVDGPLGHAKIFRDFRGDRRAEPNPTTPRCCARTAWEPPILTIAVQAPRCEAIAGPFIIASHSLVKNVANCRYTVDYKSFQVLICKRAALRIFDILLTPVLVYIGCIGSITASAAAVAAILFAISARCPVSGGLSLGMKRAMHSVRALFREATFSFIIRVVSISACAPP